MKRGDDSMLNHRLSAVLGIILSILPVFSQTKVWTKSYYGQYSTAANSIVAAKNGGFAVLGFISTSPVAGFWNHNYWLLRTDSQGDTLWTRQYGGSFEDFGNAITASPGGGFLLAGSSNSFSGNTKALVYRVDDKGDTLWSRSMGGATDSYCNAVLALKDDGYLLGGQSNTGNGNWSPWIFKLDANGNTLWSKVYEGYAGGKEAPLKVIGFVPLEDERTLVKMTYNDDGRNFLDYKSSIRTFVVDKDGNLSDEPISYLGSFWPGDPSMILPDGGTVVVKRTFLLNSNWPSLQAQSTTPDTVISITRFSAPTAPTSACVAWSKFEQTPNGALDIVRDRAGNTWAATTNRGLIYRKGGFWNYSSNGNSNLPSAHLTGVALDSRGDVWVSTLDAGLAILHGSTWTVFNHANSSLPSDSISALRSDATGELWIQLRADQKWVVFDGISQWDLTAHDPRNLIVTEADGESWFLDRGDLVNYRAGREGIHVPLPEDLDSLVDIGLDTDGHLLVSTNSYLWKWKDCPSLRTNRVHTEPQLVLDKDGSPMLAWTGTGNWRNFGVFFQRFTSEAKPIAVPFRLDNIVRGAPINPRLAVNSSGNWWVSWEFNTQIKIFKWPGENEYYNAIKLQFRRNEYANPLLGPIETFPSPTNSNGYDRKVSMNEMALNDSGTGIFLEYYAAKTLSRGIFWATKLFKDQVGMEATDLIPQNWNYKDGYYPINSRVFAGPGNGFVIVKEIGNKPAEILSPSRTIALPDDQVSVSRTATGLIKKNGELAIAFSRNTGTGELNTRFTINLIHYDAQGAPLTPVRMAFTGTPTGKLQILGDSKDQALLVWLDATALGMRLYSSINDSVGTRYYFPRPLKEYSAALGENGQLYLAYIALGEDTLRVEKVNVASLPQSAILTKTANPTDFPFRSRYSNGTLRFNTPPAAKVTVNLLDLQGRLVRKIWAGPGGGKEQALEAEFNTGLYALRMQTERQSYTQILPIWNRSSP
jgi:hypothetical protein